MEGIIKVSPQLLKTSAAEFGNQANAIQNLTTEMMTLITGLCSANEGEAIMTYINKFKSLEDDMQKVIRMVQEHSTDLEEMAQIVIETENMNIEEANSLASDVII